MPETRLFKRDCVITVTPALTNTAFSPKAIQITGLAMSFSVSRGLTKPNTCEVKIHNLNEDHRHSIEQFKTAQVQIEAGYNGRTSVLFFGAVRTSLSTIEGADIVTTLAAGDGEKAVNTARINKSISPNTDTADVLKEIVSALGVGEGNLKEAVQIMRASGVGAVFKRGTVLSGSAAREMTAICRASGLTWSIQNGILQILPLHAALAGTAPVISQETGMIGSPSVDSKKVLTVKCLIQPDIIPGRKIVLQAARLSGNYRLEECNYSGDTHGADWYITSKGRRY